jgi:hypothetical protein
MSPAPQDVPAARRWILPTVLAILVVGAALTSGILTACLAPGPDDIIPTPGSGGGSGTGDSWSTAPLPPQLFQGWPAGKKPDVALILTGQQYSYLKFCGCSAVQLGGFERRFNFMAKLRERGWPLVAADLGDLVQFKPHDIHDQDLLKYETAMQALEILNYKAIGLGVDDFALPLQDGMARFTLQKPDGYPRVLAANLDPTYRHDNYPHPTNDQKLSMIGDWVPVETKGAPKVGIGGLIGAAAMKTIQIADPKVKFAADNGAVVKSLQEAMTADKVELKVLLFQGPAVAAPAIAQKFPGAFDVILALSEEDTAPAQPDVVGTTIIVRVGHRGRWVGVVGAFRTGNPAKPFNLHYESVPMGDEYETAKAKEKDHPILKLLDGYAVQVRDQEFLLKRSPKRPIPVPAAFGNINLKYIGSQACAGCHAADFAAWKNTKHEHAFDALTKVANKPALRQHDPECVSCHVTGFGTTGGFDGTPATREFRNVNCENCHGPGSAHAATPANPALRAAMSPWKTNPQDVLPLPATMQKGINAMNPAERAVFLSVTDMCMKCHDLDNDPNYKLDVYWPKIIHGKNAKAVIPPPAAAVQNKPNGPK